MIAALLALLFLLSAGTAGAQQAAQSPAPAAAATPAAPAAPPVAPKTSDELLSSSLPQDIATASYYELVAWCLQLGLDDAGARPDLQARLAAHFGMALPPSAPKAGVKTVTIKSARESAYRTDDASKEKYLELRGDVVLEIKDTGNDSTQVINAASITYNQTRRTVSAVGNVTYTLTHGGQTDTFTGDSLAFDLDSSQAVFYDGKTSRVMNRSGKDVPYTFEGRTITRLTNDTVILEKGIITTSTTPENPLFSIQASTAWLLAPGEWAAQNALLMLGNVPVLYLPGFFWPGEEFMFNPNVGYQSRVGSYLQTTTYLLGRKPAQDAPFSFLQLSSAGSEGYKLEPDGLFLKKVPSLPTKAESKDTLKVLLDVYSRLGVYGGVAGNFASFGTFRTGIAFSRDIFQDPVTGGLYTPYLPVEVPGYELGQSVSNDSSLFGLTVPFRYGVDGTVNVAGGPYALNGAFQYYSNPVVPERLLQPL